MAGLLDFLGARETPFGGLLGGFQDSMRRFSNPEVYLQDQILKAQALANQQAGGLLGGDAQDMPPMGQGRPPVQSSPALGIPQGAGGGSPYAGAIASIESAGSGDYNALGPQTRTGDRAYGKYQVMGQNVGPWTKEIIGKEMSPQEFLASPQAQDAVFNAKFGSYAQKYGPEGAARAWFAGEGGMNDLGRKDQLGTTVGGYGQKFAANLGQQPTQVASLAPTGGEGLPPAISQGPPSPQMAQAPVNLAQAVPAPAPTPTQAPAVSADPAVQRQINQLSRMLTNPNLGKGAQEAIKSRLDALQKSQENPPPIKEYEYARRQGYKGSFEEWQSESEKRKQNQINVNAFANPLVKGLSDQFIADRDKARSYADDIRAIHSAREQVDAGGIFGAGADLKLGIAKLGSALGMPNDKIASTEAFRSAIGERVLALVKNLGAGSGISNADVTFAQKIAGGEISLDEASIRRILDIGERGARARIKLYNEQADKFGKQLPDDAKAYGALMGVAAPGDYVKPQASQPAGGGRIRTYNPATGKLE